MVSNRLYLIWILVLLLIAAPRCRGNAVQPQAEVTSTPSSPPLITTTPAHLSVYPRFEINEEMEMRVVKENVFVVTHAFPWPHNSLAVKIGQTLLLVDTPYTPEATQEMLRWFKEYLQGQQDEFELVAINTGFHYDNLGGNSYLVEEGIPIHGSTLTAQLLAERGEALRELTLTWLGAPEDRRYYEAHEQLAYVAPTRLFDLQEGLELTFDEETVQVIYPGPSHTPDNVVVYFPARKLLFGGCMILSGDSVGNTSDADLEAWPGAVRSLLHLEVDMVIPGHGERLDPGLLAHTINVLTK